MTTFLYFLAVLVGGYTIANTLYLAVWASAGLFGGADDGPPVLGAQPFKRIVVLIPAYKEDAVILESVRVNLKQAYPPAYYNLVVIADSFQPDTLARLEQLPVQIIEVSFENSSVTNALKAALAQLPDDAYDVVVVSDADNHLAPDFLSRINQAFHAGWQAVQGHRLAKNTNTSVAILDAISEEVNNHIFRRGHRALGFSAALIGSGMAFDYALMKKHLLQITTVGGYDKELEMRLLREGIRIGYLQDALVFDEKVQNPATFERQRTRWVEAQIQQARQHLGEGLRQVQRGNFDYAEKVLQTLVLPRILLLGLLTIGLLTGLLFQLNWLWELMGGQLLVLLLTLTLSLPGYLRRLIGLNELLMVPILFARFTRSVINFRRARGRFLHTPHGTNTDLMI